MSTAIRFAPDSARLPRPDSASRQTVLCLTRDAGEQAEYAMLLCRGGWAVSPVKSVEEATGLLSSGRYAAVIVGSVSLADQFAIGSIVRREFEVPVLVICDALMEPNLPCDAVLPRGDRHRILSVLQRLTARAA